LTNADGTKEHAMYEDVRVTKAAADAAAALTK
jgi:hypothetical protein